MPRARADTVVFRVAITLHLDHDRDLVEFFDSHPPGSKDRQGAIKAALRGGLSPGNDQQEDAFSEQDLLDAVLSFVL